MIQPVDLQDFFITFFSAAMVIIAGAAYALLFALSRVNRMPRLMPFAYLAYTGLFVSVLVLAEATHLYGFWRILVVTMLLGYLLAPHGIWHLCEGTHAALDDEEHEEAPHPE
ncbi:MAG: hypothetical protein U9R74_06865 [Pseudomonadota bacterium]|nr:hypothetical protein [Pseudomonadota bacterium]